MSVADLDVTTHETVVEMLAAYACYAIDDLDDLDVVERHLEVCAVCRAELDENLAALTALVGPDEMPGDHVWLGIAAATGGLEVDDVTFPEMGAEAFDVAATSTWNKIVNALHEDVPLRPDEIVLTRRWIRFFVVSGLTAVLMLLTLIAAQDLAVRDVADSNALDAERLAAIDATLDPSAEIVAFEWVNPMALDGAEAPLTAVLLDGSGWLVRSHLEPVDSGHYQLWFDAGGTLTPVRELTQDGSVTAFDVAETFDALVVTVEAVDGSTTPVLRAEIPVAP